MVLFRRIYSHHTQDSILHQVGFKLYNQTRANNHAVGSHESVFALYPLGQGAWKINEINHLL